MPWAKIDSAPKDGTFILVFGTAWNSNDIGAPKMGVAQWRDDTYTRWQLVDNETQKLVTVPAGYWDCDGIDASHWMSLPDPPDEGTTR